MVPDSRIYKDIKSLPSLNADESKWVVSQMEYKGLPLIVRANYTAKDWVGHRLLSVKVGCAIPFKKPSMNGLPDPNENEQVLNIEDVIVEEFRKRLIGLLAFVLTTGTMRELVFYVKNCDDIDALKKSILTRVKTHEVQFLVANEPNWDSYINFAPAV